MPRLHVFGSYLASRSTNLLLRDLLAVTIHLRRLLTVRVVEGAFSVFLTITPDAHQFLPIRVVECSTARAIVVGELAVVHLTIGPIVATLALFLV